MERAMKHNDIITIVIACISLVFSIGTFFVSYYSERKRMTIDAYKDLQEHLHFLYLYGKDEIEDFVENYTSEEYKAISSAVSQIEIFAQGVKSRTYNMRLVYLLSHGYLDMTLRNRIEHILDMKLKKSGKEYHEATRWLMHEMDRLSCKKKVYVL